MSKKYSARELLLPGALAALCALGVFTDLAGASSQEIRSLFGSVHGAAYVVAKVLCSLPSRDEALVTVLFAALLFAPLRAVHGVSDSSARRAGGRAAWVVAALFAAAMLFGRSFDEVGSSAYVTGGIAEALRSAIFFLGWLVLAHAGICLLFSWLDCARGSVAAARGSAVSAPPAPAQAGRRGICARARAALDRHPFAVPAAVLAVAWLPVLIGYAPALFMWDTNTQILQWFGLPNHISESVELIDPAVLLTQHHPPLHTAMVGLCVQAGMALFGNENAGIFLYALLQWALDIAAIAWALRLLALMGVRSRVRLVVLAFIALVPAFSNYSVIVTKDVPFAAVLLVFAMELAYLVWRARSRAGQPDGQPGNPADARPAPASPPARRAAPSPSSFALPPHHVTLLLLSALGTALLRSGMLVTVALACLVALVLVRRQLGARRYPAVALLVAVLVSLALSNVVYPALGISPSSKREVLSIPFQQVARFMRDHPGSVSAEEFRTVDAVLDANELAAIYTPSKSDPVKATFREDATPEDLARFMRLWAQWFAEEPGCFLEALAENYYGYFYAGRAMVWSYTPASSAEVMASTEVDWFSSGIAPYFDFAPAENPVSRVLSGACEGYRLLFQSIPFTTLTMQAALYDWVLALATVYAATRRVRPLAPVLAAAWVVLAVALVGPCNATTYFRYAYPVAFLAPFMCALLFTRSNKEAIDA
ncbi:DUF6020 family protein [[Collinsella] massiliensis]|uniref:Uncharacterized protein n=1 Tax=[Collinsella] massiliensis TaxID=1232426 RepID=A0A1Y3XZU7_9ACTN|nr:DUF6020 family protein [[Collinsella] massiliensis]OUN87550.1 hypothetical protein B5G02_07315 [[Collinsella] massiliensis]